MLKSFSAALSFLTVFRIPFTDSILSPKELGAGFACFPLAGLVLGLIYYSAAVVFQARVPGLLLSVLIACLTALLTRGLHFDGLADFADGIWGGSTPQRRLEIMKDSRSGTFGVLALIIGVSLKIASIDALISGGCLAPLLVAPVYSRFAMAATAYGSQYARKDGLAKPFLENVKIEHVAIAALLAAAATLPVGFKLMLYLVPVVGCVFLFKLISKKYLGGITGDVLGAVNEVSEIVVLVLGACTVSH
ncbi:MAG: adenosylcobinamide-GDP ribazoletransferase [Syntrophobacteraceae bacterium]|jgi:adenosylcobinamide-GDP ribazoletransferase